ncbi:hypothetical protein EV200_103427 [Pedobacter psychrotolerans]|uniref:Uncharacterized protein n=1 Tax=Pedobacter psychrotolerans TaxID=1843235 RepID=A0A4R2HJ93_9SPHI|nr:hypothetical protein [Pedobacter psychrotolerans]TCO27093.1 hypothetical protein EV200_103427 [Pedobacter psychrotolerans]
MWVLVLIENFKTTSRTSLVVNFLLSLLVCAGLLYFPSCGDLPKLIDQFVNNTISVLSLLVGFTVAMFTLLITASNPNIDEIKKLNTDFMLYSEQVSIFKMLLIRTAYIILIESILLLFNLIYPFVFQAGSMTGKIFFSLDTFMLTHIILANIGSIVDLYFVLTKKNDPASR